MAASWRESLDRGAAWFNERPIRERALITATVLVLLVVLGWDLGIAPALKTQQQLENRQRTLVDSRDSLLSQQQSLNHQLAKDPSQELRNQLRARQARLEGLNRQIADTTGQLIAPKAMVSLLREMLSAQQVLKLRTMELKTPTPVFAPEPEASDDESPGKKSEAPLLYAHDVELTIEGSYLEVLAYLEHLEALDERLGWVVLEYNAKNWPTGEAVIRVRTLSLEPAWLGV
ncbi:MSHA biogenesis protein MshJ [Marinobacter salinus]|uniref:MSHA biogenesis protein MshJ n=1 Tax=Marinobacter salinus TaxID=1874317 RepID=A0A1D9GMM7_9GAMM|nr:type II secretion system protein GspM [Marinobacter salinus]AOY88886.1 MSHA biogenesis protein MshJ [Marinobacter salinus]